MICATCGYSNPEEYQFCANCGSALYEMPDTSNRHGRKARSLLPVLAVSGAAIVCCALLACLTLGAIFVVPNLTTNTDAAALPTNRSRATVTKEALLVIPTATPTAVPTASPTSKPTAPRKLKASDAIDAFKRANLEVDSPRPMTKDDYGTVPMLADEGVQFFADALGENRGGIIYTFSSNDSLLKVKQAVEAKVNTAGIHPWVYVYSNLLLELSGQMTQQQAAQYQKPLYSIK